MTDHIETGCDYAIEIGDGVERVTVLDANYADAPGCVLARRENSEATAVAISRFLGPWRGTVHALNLLAAHEVEVAVAALPALRGRIEVRDGVVCFTSLADLSDFLYEVVD